MSVAAINVRMANIDDVPARIVRQRATPNAQVLLQTGAVLTDANVSVINTADGASSDEG